MLFFLIKTFKPEKRLLIIDFFAHKHEIVNFTRILVSSFVVLNLNLIIIYLIWIVIIAKFI